MKEGKKPEEQYWARCAKCKMLYVSQDAYHLCPVCGVSMTPQKVGRQKIERLIFVKSEETKKQLSRLLLGSILLSIL